MHAPCDICHDSTSYFKVIDGKNVCMDCREVEGQRRYISSNGNCEPHCQNQTIACYGCEELDNCDCIEVIPCDDCGNRCQGVLECRPRMSKLYKEFNAKNKVIRFRRYKLLEDDTFPCDLVNLKEKIRELEKE